MACENARSVLDRLYREKTRRTGTTRRSVTLALSGGLVSALARGQNALLDDTCSR
jgi:hypothetical protein